METRATSRGADSRVSVRNKTKADKRRNRAKKVRNRPQEPLSDFFLFMEDFRKDYEEKHPDAQIPEIGVAGGKEWRSMSDADKAPYVSKAEKLMDEYNMKMHAYHGGEYVRDTSDP